MMSAREPRVQAPQQFREQNESSRLAKVVRILRHYGRPAAEPRAV
jgi:hypothetical protein